MLNRGSSTINHQINIVRTFCHHSCVGVRQAVSWQSMSMSNRDYRVWARESILKAIDDLIEDARRDVAAADSLSIERKRIARLFYIGEES